MSSNKGSSLAHKRLIVTKEQMDLRSLIGELENSVAVVKEQINSLTVETLQLKYMLITRNKSDPDAGSASKRPKVEKLDLIIKQETRRTDDIEELDSD